MKKKKHIPTISELKEKYSPTIIGIACHKWWLELDDVNKIGTKVIKLIKHLATCDRSQFIKTYRFYIRERRKYCITLLKMAQKEGATLVGKEF